MISVVDPEVGPRRHMGCPLERVDAPQVSAKRLERYRHGDRLPRKARREIICMGSVLKPTQVDEASSLRCSRELCLRNSANSPRNFGRRGAGASRPQ
jgi:hypothetical protein